MEKGRSMRLFFALWPPPKVVERLSEYACLSAAEIGGKATRPETLHLTLAFLGDQPEELLPDIIAAAQRVHCPLMDVVIDRIEAWRHNRLLCAGISQPEKLVPLHETLLAMLRAQAIPSDDEAHQFVPHVTLVRKLPDRAFPFASRKISIAPWQSKDFALVESVRPSAGANYRTIATFPLWV